MFIFDTVFKDAFNRCFTTQLEVVVQLSLLTVLFILMLKVRVALLSHVVSFFIYKKSSFICGIGRELR